jgi:predicted polyphosphate/ATP-dependent NAD kinase
MPLAKKRIGIIVNPVAGLGGRVGLKGTDGAEILARALQLGAVPEAPGRAITAIQRLKALEEDVEIVTYPREMGEDEARASGLEPRVIGQITSGETTAEDTMRAAKGMLEAGVDIILFAGGDGTARNIYDAVDQRVAVIGIPAGCKIHSAVYAINPQSAGDVVVQYILGKVTQTREAEVMDIDEDAFREGIVTARLYGYLKVPNERTMVQNLKSGRGLGEAASISGIGRYLATGMVPDCLYVIGPGTTTRGVMEEIGFPKTLLGVDLVYNKHLIAKDVTEREILEHLQDGRPAKIIVTVIGGQGYIFGRGNQQISPKVIRKVGKENIIIVATKDKMVSLVGKSLLVDTGDQETDRMLSGYMRVIVGYEDTIMFKVG